MVHVHEHEHVQVRGEHHLAAVLIPDTQAQADHSKAAVIDGMLLY